MEGGVLIRVISGRRRNSFLRQGEESWTCGMCLRLHLNLHLL